MNDSRRALRRDAVDLAGEHVHLRSFCQLSISRTRNKLFRRYVNLLKRIHLSSSSLKRSAISSARPCVANGTTPKSSTLLDKNVVVKLLEGAQSLPSSTGNKNEIKTQAHSVLLITMSREIEELESEKNLPHRIYKSVQKHYNMELLPS